MPDVKYKAVRERQEAIWREVEPLLRDGAKPYKLARQYHIAYLSLLRVMRDHGYPGDYSDLDARLQRKLDQNRNPNAGTRTMGRDKFIQRAQAVHGDKYDYSKVEYVNTKTKVEIVCPIHGSFWQVPEAHLAGSGCNHKECVEAKKISTCRSRYGVDRPLQCEAFVDKARLAKAGAMVDKTPKPKPRQAPVAFRTLPGPMLTSQDVTEVTVRRLWAFDKKNACDYTTAVYERLVMQFGQADVVQLQDSNRSSLYDCDFYIPSRNLYIKLNTGWQHCARWFDETCDAHLVSYLVQFDEYQPLADVWAGVDVTWREAVRNAGLNCVVFWDARLRDMDLWFGMNCPDGRDWDHEYSWIPNRDVAADIRLKALTGTIANLSQVAKSYQLSVFYEHEMRLWRENRLHQDLPLQVFLYWNRYKYLGKTPCMLTNSEILRGFSISGVRKGFTVFHAELMDQAVKKYSIRSVYDPCSGWGERALYCKSHGDLPYLGVDVNAKLFSGYAAMQRDLNMQNQNFVCADSASVPLHFDADAVLTCPPYLDVEVYSENGAENLPESEFYNWWQRVVENSLKVNPRYFCVQTNLRCRDNFANVIAAAGFKLIDELFYDFERSSHLTRKKGGISVKSERESMLVFEKI